jgi:hypothetical protein
MDSSDPCSHDLAYHRRSSKPAAVNETSRVDFQVIHCRFARWTLAVSTTRRTLALALARVAWVKPVRYGSYFGRPCTPRPTRVEMWGRVLGRCFALPPY